MAIFNADGTSSDIAVYGGQPGSFYAYFDLSSKPGQLIFIPLLTAANHLLAGINSTKRIFLIIKFTPLF